MNEEEIRRKAEEVLHQKEDYLSKDLSQEQDLPKIIEELQIHQIELELQNQEMLSVQEELLRAQRKYQDLYNFAPVGYFTFNQNGIILEANLTAAKLLKMPRSRLIGRTLTPYLTHESIVTFYEHCHAVLTDVDPESSKVCDLVLKDRAQDTTTYVQVESLPVQDETGTYAQIHSAIVDVTAHHLAEEALRVSERNWKALVNNTDDLVWAVDRSYALILANRAFTEKFLSLTGYRLKPGVNILSIMPQQIVDKWRRFFSRTFLNESFSVEVALGEEFFEIHFNPIVDDSRAAVGAAVFARDISSRKKMEEALRQRNKELDAFAHTVAHNLQRPLGLVAGYADYIDKYSDDLDPTERRSVGEKIKESAQKASQIVDDLLFLAGVRKRDVDLKPLEMRQFVNQAIKFLGYTIDEMNAHIDVSDDLPEAMGYGVWLEEIWINYIENSLKYGGTPPKLEIGGEVQADGMVRFWVRDNGSGLFPESQESLFMEFTQLDEQNVERSGLGLSIVKQIAEKMGGTAGISTSPEQGSEFYFTLPPVPEDDA